MKFRLFGRIAMGLLASAALGLGMTACGGGTIGYIWVLGQQYNQIGGFKVDDYTGNLTAIPDQPFSAGGNVPVSLVLKPGGRYLYVLDQGTATAPLCTGGVCAADPSSGIVQYAVGGDGTLTYQQTFHSQGFVPKWMQFDSTGQYLYVLDTFNPLYQPNVGQANFNNDSDGSVTAFSVDGTTGKLTLVTNPNVKNGTGTNTTYFEVGQAPLMMKSIGSCLYTVNSASQTLTPYIVGTGGALTPYGNVTFPVGSTNITSINGSGSFMLLTDNQNLTTAPGQIYFYSVGSGCVPTAIAGSPYANLTGTADPSYSLIDNSSKYVYIVNKMNNTTGVTGTPYSSISAFTISTTNSELQPITTSGSSTYATGSSPVCIIEDTSNQYIYVSNFGDGSVTGKVIDQNTGSLSDLPRGSVFKTVGNPGCLVLSGAVD